MQAGTPAASAPGEPRVYSPRYTRPVERGAVVAKASEESKSMGSHERPTEDIALLLNDLLDLDG
ncbi:hypothetical protein MES4922_10289 [Mesorhizobium ventifaucium]|uniref:Uncharacterized protein n=1 Tax=Mesorhizobium ventifaucium TaxID=666020 RepID=A0ABM9DF58_9HYPH|nr:hypothetical protein MES4922_10289 [Mesorhizobium ventifaucium]